MTPTEIIERLRPDAKPTVYSLVKEAGHNVDNWSIDDQGSPIEPNTNSYRSAQWVHRDEPKPPIRCAWHQEIEADGARVVLRENYREVAGRHAALATDMSQPAARRSGATTKARKARDVDAVMARAFESGTPLRLILAEGTRREGLVDDVDPSQVDLRRLDEEPWYVESYSRNGDTLLVRGVLPSDRPPSVVPGEELDPDFRGPPDDVQQRAIRIRRGQDMFRKVLLEAWGRRCAVTGCNVVDVLEAAHIVPHASELDYRPSNGLLLRSDIHTLYDCNLLSVDANYLIHLAPRIQLMKPYDGLHGFKLKEPMPKGTLRPSAQSLDLRHQTFREKYLLVR